MKDPSQTGVCRVSKRGEGCREEEDVEQQHPIQEHPTGECAHQATKRELNFLRDIMMSNVISQLNGELNPRPAYNNGVYFEHRRFCEDCIDKVTAAIMDGLRKERKYQHKNENEDAPVPIVPIEEENNVEKEYKIEKNKDDDLVTNVSYCPSEEEGNVITPDNARKAARIFLNELNFRVNDHVSFEFFNREGMKKCLNRDLFGGLPYEVARVVDRFGHDGKYTISEKLLGQHAYAATRSTGIVYDENDQEPIIKLSDHSGLTIGEVLNCAIGDKRCSCMQSEGFKENERKDVEELVNLAKANNTTTCNGYNTVIFKKVENSISDGSIFYSDSEEDEDDLDSNSEEELADSNSEEELADSNSEEELADSNSEEELAVGGVKRRIVNDDFRPSRSVTVENERGDAPPLCLSICRHFDGNNCPFNTENKRKIFNSINFAKKELKDEESGGGEVILIDGERHKIELRSSSIPSFAIGSSVYEVLVYDHDPLIAASVSSSNKNTHDEVKYDHAMNVHTEVVSKWEDEEEGTRMSTVASALCDQTFAKPCAKAYLTVTTAAVPWPCIIKTPPMSDVNSEGKYGSFRSFVVPLPCSYGGRRLNDSTNGWRSKIYSNFVEDFVRRSVRPIPKGRLLNLSRYTWSFSTRDITHHQLKVFGSVLRSECGDLDPSPLEYKASTSLCSRDTIEAQSDFSKLHHLLDTCNKDLDTFTEGPYREATVKMRNIASEIEQEMGKNTKDREDAAKKALLETLNGQFEEQHKRVVFMNEMATKQINFGLQLERQLNYLLYLCASFVPGFKINK